MLCSDYAYLMSSTITTTWPSTTTTITTMPSTGLFSSSEALLSV